MVNKIVVFKKDVEVYHYVGKDKVLNDPLDSRFRGNDNLEKKYFSGSNTLTYGGGAGT